MLAGGLALRVRDEPADAAGGNLARIGEIGTNATVDTGRALAPLPRRPGRKDAVSTPSGSRPEPSESSGPSESGVDRPTAPVAGAYTHPDTALSRRPRPKAGPAQAAPAPAAPGAAPRSQPGYISPAVALGGRPLPPTYPRTRAAPTSALRERPLVAPRDPARPAPRDPARSASGTQPPSVPRRLLLVFGLAAVAIVAAFLVTLGVVESGDPVPADRTSAEPSPTGPAPTEAANDDYRPNPFGKQF